MGSGSVLFENLRPLMDCKRQTYLVFAHVGGSVGLSNVLAVLGASAVLARALGVTCLVAVSGYAKDLFGSGSMPVFPCIIIDHDVWRQFSKFLFADCLQTTRYHDYRIQSLTGQGNAHERAVIEVGGGPDYTRQDLCHLLAPPGMPGSMFWPIHRAVYTEMLFALSNSLPVDEHETQVDPTETICGHMRMRDLEGSPGALLCRRDCKVLKIMEQIYLLHVEIKSPRQYTSFAFTGAADCNPCIGMLAPKLIAHLKLIRLVPNVDARMTRDSKTKHIMDSKTGAVGDHSDAAGAFRDMRTLTRCATLVYDDSAKATFASTVISAGMLAPAGYALDFLRIPNTKRYQYLRIEYHSIHIAIRVKNESTAARPLCDARDTSPLQKEYSSVGIDWSIQDPLASYQDDPVSMRGYKKVHLIFLQDQKQLYQLHPLRREDLRIAKRTDQNPTKNKK